MPENANPLQKHFRRPVIYFKLPSGGQFWPEGSVELTVTGEIPVFPMTTKDEITIRTPDALLNGQGVVDVIKSCIPNIKDPWKMPSIDVDATLIAIRIASYSNMMEVESKCPHCGEENEYSIDLNNTLANITAPNYNQTLITDDLIFKFKPQQYFEVNKTSLLQFEEQKMLNLVSDTSIPDEEKTALFSEQLSKLVDIGNMAFVNCTESITTPDGNIVTNKTFINEFYKNASRSVTSDVKKFLEGFVKSSNVQPVEVTCADCEKSFKVNITFDHSNFFA